MDTNGDGVIDSKDSCIPTGGFINALRPIKLAQPLIEKAIAGEVSIHQKVEANQNYDSQAGTVVIHDDFSDPKSGWPTTTDELGSNSYQKGEYLFTVTPPKKIVWVNGGDILTDSEMNINARVVKTSKMGGYGLLCRLNKDQEFYGFEVTEDGYYTIWKRIKGEYVFLQYWAQSDLVSGSKSMKITASCIGDQLSLAVDGKLLAKVTDTSLSSGNPGMFVETYDNGGFTIAFDNYDVSKP